MTKTEQAFEIAATLLNGKEEVSDKEMDEVVTKAVGLVCDGAERQQIFKKVKRDVRSMIDLNYDNS